MGLEGAAVLMTLLGAIGSLFAGIQLVAVFHLPGERMSNPHVLLFMAVLAMLLARSVIHVRAGIKGTSGIDSDGATDAAARYYSFGVVSSVIAGGALMVETIMTSMRPVGLVLVATVVYLLLAWPLALRRFFTERNFSALMAGSEGPNRRRAPDAGLTAIGWLLLATGVFGLAISLPNAIFHAEVDLTRVILSGAFADLGEAAAGAARSPWWSVGVALAQLWAAVELINMTDRHRLAANVYGVIAAVVTAYLYWPMVKDLDAFTRGPMASVPGFMQLALELVVPIGTIVLANRKLMPVAQARIL
jgi:hypothetical protein